MFVPQRWAAAFINAMGDKAGEGFTVLGILSAWIKELPGAVFGSLAAKRLERLTGKEAEKIGPGEAEILRKCSRFVCLLVKRDLFKHIDPVLREIEKILNGQRGILPVIVESALPLDGELEALITEGVKKRKGAAELRLEKRINPVFIGGIRLRMADEVIDASLCGQLRRMADELASGAFTVARSGAG
jgi:F-type H+-transporting ATPase subunit delta